MRQNTWGAGVLGDEAVYYKEYHTFAQPISFPIQKAEILRGKHFTMTMEEIFAYMEKKYGN